MNEMQVFENAEFGSVRTLNFEGKPWFVGKDVAEILGYVNPRKALIDHVDDEDKGVTKCDTLGGIQELTIINESGLYSLILASQLPKAKAFKRWVTSEVLPAIRRNGMYATDELLENPDLAIAIFTQLRDEREKRKQLELMNAIQNQQIAELKPKASYYDLILQNKNTVAVTAIAKDYGMSARTFNKLLHDMGVQYKLGNIWLLYQKYADQGYTQSRTYAVDAEKNVMHTYWTQKGRLFLYDLLKHNGVLPVIEKEAV